MIFIPLCHEIPGYHALITYAPEIEMFWDEFIDLNGGADERKY